MAEEKNNKASEAADEESLRHTKHRSPNYPVIGLRAALNRAAQLYKRYKRNPVPINLAHKEWDYKEHSGLGNQVVGALRSFGLVSVEGKENDRRVSLTDLAYRIFNHGSTGSAAWHDLLKKAALEPPIYAELWAKWGGDDFPDDGLIKHYLILDREEAKFNPDKVDGFIENFRDTLRFANLLPNGTLEQEATDNVVIKTSSVAVGDYVQWTNAGKDMFDPPQLVRGISNDGQWAFVEGSETGVPMNELTAMNVKPDAKSSLSPTPPPSPFAPSSGTPKATVLARRQLLQSGVKEDVFTLDEGLVVIQYPERLSQESFEDFESWLQLVIRKAKRSIQRDDEVKYRRPPEGFHDKDDPHEA